MKESKIKKARIKKCECGKQIQLKGVDLCEDCQIEYNAYAANRLYKKLFGNKLNKQ